MNDHDQTDEFIDDLADRLDLSGLMAALADATATTPPRAVRSGLAAAIAGSQRQPTTPAPVADLYVRRVAAMAAVLDELADSDWKMPAAPYEWTVHGLVAHLTVIEEYTLRQLGLGDEPALPVGAPSANHHLLIGADAIAEMVAGNPGATVQRWRAAAHRIAQHATGAGFDPTGAVPLHAWPFDALTALVVRAFEIWTHADDIRRATGRPLDLPSAAELRTMSSTSVHGLPLLLTVTGGPSMQPTRVVLTGPGGGTFDLGGQDLGGQDLGGHGNGGAASANLLVANVVDYCRVASRRVNPADLAGQRSGDHDLIDALLRAASAIAV